ncbi:MAG: tyrosine--tRNA ligase [Candidatus Caenarcaniphilales bacterium]|nr:tyrosine--tRNA ligase [Candidatus Caenarcaniphilales bacterium]
MNSDFLKLSIDEQADYLMSGGAELLPAGKKSLKEKLVKARDEKRPLRIKLGIDPTGSDLHLGHTVCLQVLRRFQNLGHQPVLLIGGFTAQLGDPTGRNEARPPLTEEEVKKNSESFLAQISKVIDLEKVEVVNNADWLKKLDLGEILKLASTTTINQLVGKEAFGERLDQGHPLYVHEIFYPILQGYDSVAIKADIEIGGTDQRFNVLAGRDLQKHFGQDPQIVLLMPLLIGLDGKKKMSKTADNYIALHDSPKEMFGKTMSLPDEQLINWWELLTDSSIEETQELKNKLKSGANPRDLKMQLARKIIEFYYTPQEALKAQEDFITKFQKKELPDEIPEFKLKENQNIIDILFEAGLVESKGEARRLIAGQGVKVNSEKAVLETPLKINDVIQVGKRKFVKLV